MKDSRQLSSEDMEDIVTIVQESPHTKIIITHGTYVMPDTAKVLKSKLTRSDHTIIFTGSMVPLRGFSGECSDAGFNLGYAVAKSVFQPHSSTTTFSAPFFYRLQNNPYR